MKRLLLVQCLAAFLVQVAGCAGPRFLVRGEFREPHEEVLSCAVRQLKDMGYRIEREDRRQGVIRAGKGTTEAMVLLLTSRFWGDIITVSGQGDPGQPPSQIQVKGQSYMRGIKEPIRTLTTPSEEVRRDILLLLRSCGATAIAESR